MKVYKKICITAIVIIILSNTTPFVWMLKNTVDERHYRYSNYNGSNTFCEFMDLNFEMMKSVHASCLSHHPDQKDKNIYRLFSKNPLAFWRWRLYLFDRRYKLPFKNWDDIKNKRENLKETTGCRIVF